MVDETPLAHPHGTLMLLVMMVSLMNRTHWSEVATSHRLSDSSMETWVAAGMSLVKEEIVLRL